MFLKRFREIRRTLGFQLNVWHAGVFLVTSVLLFTLIFFLLRTAIDRTDRDPVQSRLRECCSVYRQGDIPALREWEARINNARLRPFFVRVTKSDGAVLFEAIPIGWSDSDRVLLGNANAAGNGEWIRLPRDTDVDLTIASERLTDGTLLQIGRMSDSLAEILAKIRQVFLTVIPPVILIGTIGGALLANRLSRPISGIINAGAEIIRTGRMDVRVPTRSSDDELQDLVGLFNRLLEHNEMLIRALRESLDNVAHDLRTPLARLRATLDESLRRNTLDRDAHNTIANALEESERVETIINALMDVTLAEAGSMKLQIADVDLRTLIGDAVDLYEDVAHSKSVTIRNSIENPVLARVDATRMRQVFANLLDNAIKYTPSGGDIFISAQQQNDTIQVYFSDTGIGISDADLPRIWDRLYRGDRSRSEEGLGLGLSLVKAIVGAHNGRVEATSRPGIGSAFTIFLPTISARIAQALRP